VNFNDHKGIEAKPESADDRMICSDPDILRPDPEDSSCNPRETKLRDRSELPGDYSSDSSRSSSSSSGQSSTASSTDLNASPNDSESSHSEANKSLSGDDIIVADEEADEVLLYAGAELTTFSFAEILNALQTANNENNRNGHSWGEGGSAVVS